MGFFKLEFCRAWTGLMLDILQNLS